jgi:pimeloyl-ACP methyl ester carboxylesterase/predicted glycosyltransferase
MRAVLAHTEGTVDRNGVKLHYQVYGDGAQTILFLPPWMLIDSRGYKAQIPFFSDTYRCITWDPRGNGKSDKPTDPSEFGQDHYVADALSIMDATNTKAAIIFGFSLSTPTCALLASHYPARVEAMISVASHTPLVPKFEHNDGTKFDNPTPERPKGWQKFARDYWVRNLPDFAEFFASQVFIEPHSSKLIEDIVRWAEGTTGEILAASIDASVGSSFEFDEEMYRRIKCPVLVVHGRLDRIARLEAAEKIAELTGAELEIWNDVGHSPHGRYPARFNLLMDDFLQRKLGVSEAKIKQQPKNVGGKIRTKAPKKVLYLSSSIGLGHARRDLAVARELRQLYPDMKIDWLAQDPVTRFLVANNERVHSDSVRLASESEHIEAESGEHDLNAFQAIRNMDEILVKNFMVFQKAVDAGGYDLVVGDEAWDVDFFWHEHPELKRTQMAWLTDFVGWLPMPENGSREAFLTTDYNAAMIDHVDANPGVRDRAIFVGNVADIIPQSFGAGLPEMGEWIPAHFDFSGYIIGRHPCHFGDQGDVRQQLGYREDEKICIVTVGGSGVGGNLIRRVLVAYPMAKTHIPELRMIVVTGPRLNPAQFTVPIGVEVRAFVPDLDRHLAACDLALIQGGLTTSMELTAAGTPFLYFPLKNHFEQNFHVAHRLDQYQAGRRMIYDESPPEIIASAMVEELSRQRKFKPVEADGAERAARMIAELL